MSWLTNWDDLIHGTAVFAAAVPFAVALTVATLWPGRAWIALAAALAIPFLWLFGWPGLPPHGSEEALVGGLIAAIALIAAELHFQLRCRWRLPLRLAAWTALSWSLYPAWLAQEGGLSRKALVAGGMGAFIAAWSLLQEWLMQPRGTPSLSDRSISPAALVPPTVALAVLLQLGGSMQFAQGTAALAAGVAALCTILLWKGNSALLKPAATLWAIIFAIAAWGGWLFAEIHVPSALLLLGAPPASLAANLLPRRQHPFAAQLQEAVPSAIVAAAALWFGWCHYQAANDNMGY